MKIVMVCLGNICRSPLAEGILKDKIKALHLDWEVDSAGMGSWHIGQPPDPRSIAIAAKYGIDISGQRARQFKASDLENYDLIFAMDNSNFRAIQRMVISDSQKKKVKLIMNGLDAGMNQSVPDPYWDDDGFEQVFQMLDNACEGIIEKFYEEHGQPNEQ